MRKVHGDPTAVLDAGSFHAVTGDGQNHPIVTSRDRLDRFRRHKGLFDLRHILQGRGNPFDLILHA